MAKPLTQSVTLNNGMKMPILGLGVYQSAPGKVTEQAVSWALEAGYRHIDTAAIYRNEADVGRALKASGIPREEVFLTTKLATGDVGSATTRQAFDKSLKELGVDYVDLYLIHWPVPEKRIESWKILESMLAEKRARALGVSNYMQRHIEELFGKSSLVPAVNQIEFSPFLYLRELQDYCARRGIQIEAYGPLTQGKKLSHPAVGEIAKRHERTPAQVLLRWAVQQELVVIPKSVHKERIEENAKIFDFSLSSAEMKTLGELNENFRTCWNPTDAP